MRDADDRRLPAPQLRETADIWWDSGTDPVICWDASAHRFWLADGADDTQRLALWSVPDTATRDPLAIDIDIDIAIAAALRDGLAACDFPPTQEGVSPQRAQATLRVAGIHI